MTLDDMIRYTLQPNDKDWKEFARELLLFAQAKIAKEHFEKIADFVISTSYYWSASPDKAFTLLKLDSINIFYANPPFMEISRYNAMYCTEERMVTEDHNNFSILFIRTYLKSQGLL